MTFMYDRVAREADEKGFHELAEQSRGVASIEKSSVILWECRNFEVHTEND